MQIILTEEEYTALKEMAENSKVISKKYTQLVLKHSDLTTKFDGLQSKYYKLLAHGVSINNEKLKNSSTKQEY